MIRTLQQTALAALACVLAPAASAGDLSRIDYPDGVYFQTEGPGYRFVIGCDRPDLVEFRVETLSLPFALREPGTYVHMIFARFDGAPANLPAEILFHAGDGETRDAITGMLRFSDELTLALEAATGLKVTTKGGETVFADAIGGFEDALFFMQEGCL